MSIDTFHYLERDCGRPLSLLEKVGVVGGTMLLLGTLGAWIGALLAVTLPTVSLLGSTVLFGSCTAVLGGEIFVHRFISLKAQLTDLQASASMIALMMTTVAVALAVGTLVGILAFELAAFLFLFIASLVALAIFEELFCPEPRPMRIPA